MIHSGDVKILASQLKRGDVLCSGLLDAQDKLHPGPFTAYSDARARWNAGEQSWTVDFDGFPTPQWFADGAEVWIEPRT
jgi:hypothetical protein